MATIRMSLHSDSETVGTLAPRLYAGGAAYGWAPNIVWRDDVAGSYVDTDVDYGYDEWQRWTIDVNIDTGIFTVQVGDQNSGPIDYQATGFTMDHMQFEGGWAGGLSPNNEVYIDAVPEPSTLVGLLTMAISGLVFYVRHKR